MSLNLYPSISDVSFIKFSRKFECVQYAICHALKSILDNKILIM